MENQIPSSNLSKAAKKLLESFFWNRIRAFENTTKTDYRMSKQQQIRRLGRMIEAIILTNSYAFFEVGMLEHSCDDIQNLDCAVIVKNFRDYVPGLNPSKFRIIINETWNGFSIWQRSLDDTMWNLLPKEHKL